MNQVFSIESAPKPISTSLRSEIERLWQAEKVNIQDVDTRIAQIRYTARDESGSLAGVCSSTVKKGIFNSLCFHSMRVMVGSAFRQNLLAFDLLAHLVEELTDNRQGNSREEPAGANVVIQTPIVAERGAIHCARTFQFPINKTPKVFVLSGFSPNGHPEYCHFFPDTSDATRAAEERWANTTEAFSKEATVQPVTRAMLSDNEAQVRLLLGQENGSEDLGDKILYSLKHKDQLLAVCELVPRFVPEINGSLLGMRMHTSAKTDSLDIQGCFAREIHNQLNHDGVEQPHKAVGLFKVYSGRTNLPTVCPVTRFHLHGIDAQGRELRVRFFEEVKVTVPLQ